MKHATRLLCASLLLAGCGDDAHDPSAPTPNPQGEGIALAELSYTLAATGEAQEDTLSLEAPGVALGPDDLYFGQRSVRESAALVNFILGLEAATGIYFEARIHTCDTEPAEPPTWCADMEGDEYCDGGYEEEQRLSCLASSEAPVQGDEAVAAMDDLLAFLRAEAAEIGEDRLAGEIEMAELIRDNMREGGGAPNGYGDPRNIGAPQAGGFEADAAAGAGAGGGGLGATPGGAQDMGYIRTVLEAGHVPLPTHLAVEGLFSEHDLPLAEEEPCDQLLCVRAGLGVAPALDTGDRAHFVQLGFSSGLTDETFQRQPQNLCVVLDVSGSMGSPAMAQGEEDPDPMSKMEAARVALSAMVDQLGPQDQLSILLFNTETQLLLPSAPVEDADAIKRLIAGINDGGGTNIEGALRRGFEIVEAHSDPARQDRVLLLTDALPNHGATGEDDFLTLAQRYAERGVNLSTFGVGINFGQELVASLSQIRGGNYFFLESTDRIQEIFEEEFEFLVTPLAYDMNLHFAPMPGYRIHSVHGVGGYEEGDEAVRIQVPTLFLSRSRGAIVIRLERVGPAPM